MANENTPEPGATRASNGEGERVRVGVDVGGTFTDVVLVAGADLVTAKVPTTDDQSVGVIKGIEKACAEAEIDSEEIDAFAHGTTVSVNALLEESGAKTALVTTEGFRDVLEIGRQARPSLYDLSGEKPTPLVPRRRRFEVAERATVAGIEREASEEAIADLVDRIEAADVESVAVCLLHAYAHPENERQVVETLRESLSMPVSASHEVLATFREYERTSTTVVNAYLVPLIDAYVGSLEDRTAEIGVPASRVMQSNGGVADADVVRERAVTTVLSGPAAGVVAAEAIAGAVHDRHGHDEHATGDDAGLDSPGDPDDFGHLAGVVTFDMGGTSSDVSLVREGEIERSTENEIGGRPIAMATVDVHTVGAGGGSIAWVDSGGALRVGPRSAGAEPGPACYGFGGTDPTVTDANVVLGYIGEGSALGGELELDRRAAEDVLRTLADEADLADSVAAARGVFEVANANMTRAIRAVTVERGYDPREFGLVAFGGAGPMHAAALAADLDVETVVVPRPCGVLSAYGLLAADETHDAVRTVREPLDAVDETEIERAYEDLETEVLDDASDPEASRTERAADLRYVGQSFELTVEARVPIDRERLGERFEAAHESAYGYRMDEPMELVNARATAVRERDPVRTSYVGGGSPKKGSREAFFDGEFVETAVYDRERMAPGREITGPAIFEQAESTTVVPPGWNGVVSAAGTLVLTRANDDGANGTVAGREAGG